MKHAAWWVLAGMLAGCGSGQRVVATSGTGEPAPEAAPEDWRPVPMGDLAFTPTVTETFRPEGDVLRLMCRVGGTVANRGPGSGSAALRLGVALADGTELTKTIVLDLGSRDEEHVEATFDLTDHEDAITGPPRYIHKFLDRP
jgi:hypothetical protein